MVVMQQFNVMKLVTFGAPAPAPLCKILYCVVQTPNRDQVKRSRSSRAMCKVVKLSAC